MVKTTLNKRNLHVRYVDVDAVLYHHSDVEMCEPTMDSRSHIAE